MVQARYALNMLLLQENNRDRCHVPLLGRRKSSLVRQDGSAMTKVMIDFWKTLSSGGPMKSCVPVEKIVAKSGCVC